MAINRKELLRYTGATAVGAALGAFARGLIGREPDASASPPIIPPRAARPAEPHPRAVAGHESFSQSGEDLIVAFLAYSLGITKLTYLDVGANDPVQLSNTYYFYKKGSRGVLVEPNGALCTRLRDQRPGDTVLEAGIGVAAATEADYYVMTYDGLNTFSKEEAEHQEKTSGGRVKIQKVIKMPLLDINRVMEQHFQEGAPTFLSIDTEGMDLAILRSIDFRRFRPKIFCVETLISNTRKTRPEIPEFMAKQGYVVRGSSFVNTIFVDATLLEA
jgi:FkbM family methyltransferase